MPSVRSLRLASGLLLFLYISLHLIDHTLLNISIGLAESMLGVMKSIWQSWPGAVLLYAALACHLALAFWALYERRYFHWSGREALQLVLGFSIPVLLANHILVTKLSAGLYGTDKTYAVELYSFWVGAIWLGVMQHLVLLAAWTHGCIGLEFWLRLKRWYKPWRAVLLAAAVLLPALALLGSFQGGRIVRHLAQDAAWRDMVLNPGHIGTAAQAAALARARGWIWVVSLSAIGLVLAARWLRRWREVRLGLVRIRYASGRIVALPVGMTVLDASRLHRVPHHSLCGGRGRCTTCRVRVQGDETSIPPPGEAERSALRRFAAGERVRLACQLRPCGDIDVTLLLPAQAAARRKPSAAGEERHIVAMFVDLRGSTRLAEQRLPFDAVFLINSFLSAAGRAVMACGGQTNQMMGDGLLGLFGLDCDAEMAARQAVDTAAMIARNMAELNASLTADLPEALRYGIGIASGTAVIGEIGFEHHAVFTAIGDPVNVAARLESMTKELGCNVVMGEEVYALGWSGRDVLEQRIIDVRGRAGSMTVRLQGV